MMMSTINHKHAPPTNATKYEPTSIENVAITQFDGAFVVLRNVFNNLKNKINNNIIPCIGYNA